MTTEQKIKALVDKHYPEKETESALYKAKRAVFKKGAEAVFSELTTGNDLLTEAILYSQNQVVKMPDYSKITYSELRTYAQDDFLAGAKFATTFKVKES